MNTEKPQYRRTRHAAYRAHDHGHQTQRRFSMRHGAPPEPKEEPATDQDKHLKFIPLGGCGEVTRSMYIYEYGDDIVIVDMGLQFPEEDMPGIDYLLPNIAYLKPRKNKIRGIIITHGHYDHIGAIPHLLDPLGNPPMYATALTRGMILKRQRL